MAPGMLSSGGRGNGSDGIGSRIRRTAGSGKQADYGQRENKNAVHNRKTRMRNSARDAPGGPEKRRSKGAAVSENT